MKKKINLPVTKEINPLEIKEISLQETRAAIRRVRSNIGNINDVNQKSITGVQNQSYG